MDMNYELMINFYCCVRDLKGIKKILIVFGVCYDIVVEDLCYIKELVIYYVGGYLKIVLEYIEEGLLLKMMKLGMGSYDCFKELFDIYLKQVGKEQYLIFYFIFVYFGMCDEDMVNLVLWLKKYCFCFDQVQNFYLLLLVNLIIMYYIGKNLLVKIGYKSEDVFVLKGDKQCCLYKVLLCYYDLVNWLLICQVLEVMGKKYLIGSCCDCLVFVLIIEEMCEVCCQNCNICLVLMKYMLMVIQCQMFVMVKKVLFM